MPYYEIAYETGRTSVAFYEDDAEAESALAAHHERAVKGEPGGPLGAPAERVSRVFVYDKHPNDYNDAQTMSADVLEKEVAALIKKMQDDNGVVAVDKFAVEVRALTHPMTDKRDDSHGSIFKVKEQKEMKLAFLGGEK